MDKTDDEETKEDSREDLEDSNQPFHGFASDIVDSGALDHSSDEDYQPPDEENSDILLEAAANSEKSMGKF